MLHLAVPRSNAAWRRSLFIMAMTTLGACGDTTAARVASSVNATSGNNQTVNVNAAASPLVVSVLDQNGMALSGVTVSWSIISGTGSLSTSTSTTDNVGQASVDFTAGADTGEVTVDAVVTGLDAVPFSITVTTTPTDGG